MSFVAAVGTVLVLWRGGAQVLAGQMTLGELIGFLFYLGLFYEPVGRLHGLNQMLQAARAAGERVFDILDAPVEKRAEGAGSTRAPIRNRPDGEPSPPFELGRIRGEVTYQAVGFSYAPERVVLKNVSLQARPGEMI